MPRSFYDDNYGHWHDTDDPDVQAFYRETQRRSVWKKCSICGRRVKIKPEYDKCGPCTDDLESGRLG